MLAGIARGLHVLLQLLGLLLHLEQQALALLAAGDFFAQGVQPFAQPVSALQLGLFQQTRVQRMGFKFGSEFLQLLGELLQLGSGLLEAGVELGNLAAQLDELFRELADLEPRAGFFAVVMAGQCLQQRV